MSYTYGFPGFGNVYNPSQQTPGQEYDPTQPFFHPQASEQAGLAFAHNSGVTAQPQQYGATSPDLYEMSTSAATVVQSAQPAQDADAVNQDMEEGELESDDDSYSPVDEPTPYNDSVFSPGGTRAVNGHSSAPQGGQRAAINVQIPRLGDGLANIAKASSDESATPDLRPTTDFHAQKEAIKPLLRILHREGFAHDELRQQGLHDGLLKMLYAELNLPLRASPKPNTTARQPAQTAPKPPAAVDRAAYLAQLQALKKPAANNRAATIAAVQPAPPDQTTPTVTSTTKTSDELDRQARLAQAREKAREKALQSTKRAQAEKAQRSQETADRAIQQGLSPQAVPVTTGLFGLVASTRGAASPSQALKRPVAADFDEHHFHPQQKRPYARDSGEEEEEEACIIEASDDEMDSDADEPQHAGVPVPLHTDLSSHEQKIAEMRRRIAVIEELNRQAKAEASRLGTPTVATATVHTPSAISPALSSAATLIRTGSVGRSETPSPAGVSRDEFKAQKLAQFKLAMQRKAAEKKQKELVLEELKVFGVYEDEFEEGDLETLQAIRNDAKAAFEEEATAVEEAAATAAPTELQSVQVTPAEGSSNVSQSAEQLVANSKDDPIARTNETGDDEEDSMDIDEVEDGVIVQVDSAAVNASLSVDNSSIGRADGESAEEEVLGDGQMDMSESGSESGSESDSSSDSDSESDQAMEEAVEPIKQTTPSPGMEEDEEDDLDELYSQQQIPTSTERPEVVQHAMPEAMDAGEAINSNGGDEEDDDDDDLYAPTEGYKAPVEPSADQHSDTKLSHDFLSDSSEGESDESDASDSDRDPGTGRERVGEQASDSRKEESPIARYDFLDCLRWFFPTTDRFQVLNGSQVAREWN